jgi:tetratricopeptide (TPR) repeat protein
LQSSATHYFPILQYYLLQEKFTSSYQGLWPAAKEGSDVALSTLARRASKNKDIYWLKKAASLKSLHAQLTLSKLTKGDEQIFWWDQAGNNGHGPSQFELSLSARSTQQRMQYLEKAAMNDHMPAIIALSKYYYEQNDASNALKWLYKASQFDHTSIFRMAKILWDQGKYEEATEAFERASINDYVANAYFDTIKNTPRQSLSILGQSSLALSDQCSQQLQFVATSLDSAVQASTFKKQYELDMSLNSLPICIGPIIWLAENELMCRLVGYRKVCDLTRLAEVAFTPAYTHLVFFLNEGKGYVQNGIMYLDEADTYTVFVHELAHFVGFVDEYAVSSSLATQYCNSSKAPNLVVGAKADFGENKTFQMWQTYNQALLTSQDSTFNYSNVSDEATPNHNKPIEISQSSTCAALDIKSYKPSNELTFMQFHDIRLIPPLYLMMWQDLLKQHHQSIAVSQAFKLQAQQNANETAFEHWARF